MLSRIADSLFWLNRYMERCDGLLRGVKIHYILMLDKGINENLSWRPMLETFASIDNEQIEALEFNTEAVLQLLLLDTKNINSLKVMITRARENARGVQDHITKEVWEQVNQIYHIIHQPASELQLKGVEAMYTIDLLTRECILFNGVADTTMPRGMGWNFMSMGRYIERCLLTIEMSNQYFKMIDYAVHTQNDILQWRPLLLALSGYELHLKYYRNGNHNFNAIHQVLFNEHFTRSVLYTLKTINKYFYHIINDNQATKTDALIRRMGRLLSKLKYTDFESLSPMMLASFLEEIREDLNEFSVQLGQNFFSYS